MTFPDFIELAIVAMLVLGGVMVLRRIRKYNSRHNRN